VRSSQESPASGARRPSASARSAGVDSPAVRTYDYPSTNGPRDVLVIQQLRGILTFINAFLHMRGLRCVASAKLPTDEGEFDIHVFKSALSTKTHVALVLGTIGDGENVLTRVHSACMTGDLFHSARCDCGQQLHAAVRQIVENGRGVLLYLDQEGRGIGLANKIRAYALQDGGVDTVEANERLGFPADLRDYRVAFRMLRRLGVRSLRLLSNNPRKLAGVMGEGLSLSERIPTEIPPTASTARYLRTKKEKLGHLLSSV
jgi:3,4-dihydroxy 2-butanone 4-phosphate synthase / GTP cyclohydrolase II